MARIEIVMPQMGESITEGTIVKWHKKVGDKVSKDETLLEISTDKVDSEIPSPATGILSEIVVGEQKTVQVQAVIAFLETEAGEAVAVTKPVAPPGRATEIPAAAALHDAQHPGVEPLTPSGKGRFFSPLVLSIARAEGVSMPELEGIRGSGEGGRVTKKDILAFVELKKSGSVTAPAAPTPTLPAPAPIEMLTRPVESPELRAKYPPPQYDVLQMSNVLQKMAEHMVRSVHTSPHVAAVHEVDMTNVVRHREKHAARFEQKEGFKLTFTAYIVNAVVQALKRHPMVNVSVEGDKIIKKNFIHLGIAVASENGLIVPVIRNAEEKNFLGLARALNDLAIRTRTKKLTPADIQGGTFSISNYGVFGTTFGTPIISQPQVAILGTGAIKKRPVVIEDAIAIRSIAFFTLSFDHRVIDGALGGLFLEDVAKTLESTGEEIAL